jgi:hypothetical protein
MVAIGVVLLAGCGSGSAIDATACGLRELPLRAGADAPVVERATLECQGSNVVALAVVSDPQGSADLSNVPQRLTVFLDRKCSAAAAPLVDDVVGSGVEESFGPALTGAEHAAAIAQLCASADWPVRLEVRDASGNAVTGTVRAAVTGK